MNSIFLHRDDLKTILQFMEAFDHSKVEVTCDASSGIGPIVKANLHSVDLNGHSVTVSKTIVDEAEW